MIQSFKLGKWQLCSIVSFVLIVALLTSLVVILYQPGFNAEAKESNLLNVSIDGPAKIGADTPTTYTATVEKAVGAVTYSWSITPEDNNTNFLVDGNKYLLTFTTATDNPYILEVKVYDAVGNFGVASMIVSDPPTYPSYYIGVSTAPYSYMIKADGTGWYYAVDGNTGAVVSSSTNAETVIEFACTNANSGIIKIGIGTFTCALTITTPVIIEGSGYNTKIVLPNTANTNVITILNTQNVTIRNLEIDGNKAQQSVGVYHCIFVNQSDYVTIEKSYIHSAKESCIATLGHSADWISGIMIKDCLVSDAGLGANIIIGDYTKDSWVIQNTIRKGIYGISLGGYSGIGGFEETKNIHVESNDIETDLASTQSGIYFYGGNEGSWITNNKIKGFINGYGVEISSPDGSLLRAQKNHYIAFNNIFGCGNGISLCWDYGNGYNIHCEQNTINQTVNTNANTGSGIYANYSSSLFINQNTIINTKEYGIIVDGIQNSQINNNIIYMPSQKTANTYDGIHLLGDSQKCDSNEIIGNRISNSGTTHRYSISDVSDATNDWCIIKDNIVGDAGTKEIYITSLQAQISDNIGYITEKYISTTIANNEDIAHGLVGLPSFAEIHFNGANYLGGPVEVWVDLPNSSATNLRVHASFTNGTAIAADAVTVLIYVRCTGIT